MSHMYLGWIHKHLYDAIFMKHRALEVEFWNVWHIVYLHLFAPCEKLTCCWPTHSLLLSFSNPSLQLCCVPVGQNTPTVCLQVPIPWPCRPKIAASRGSAGGSAFFYSYRLCVQMESSSEGVTLGQLVREAAHATAQWIWCHINLALRARVCVCMTAPSTRRGGDGDILGRLRQISQTQRHTFMTLQRAVRWIGSLYVLSGEYNMSIKEFVAM